MTNGVGPHPFWDLAYVNMTFPSSVTHSMRPPTATTSVGLSLTRPAVDLPQHISDTRVTVGVRFGHGSPACAAQSFVRFDHELVGMFTQQGCRPPHGCRSLTKLPRRPNIADGISRLVLIF